MASAATAPTPASAAAAEEKDPLFTTVLKRLNAFTELPFVYEATWALYWGGQLLMAPLYALLLGGWWLLEGVTGKWLSRYNKPQPGQAIVITGCDTGFGHEAAQRLAEAGWIVYAGCLTDAGMAALGDKVRQLGGGKKLVPVQMDVTKQADIDRVVGRLVADGVSLYALINNAGIGRGVPFDWAPLDEYRTIMEVNCFAVINVTKACLPLLKQSKGRVVNVSSVAGLAAAPLMSAYAASKHAVEAWSTCVRVELAPFGIKVVNINPSFHKTPIATNARPFLERTYQNLPPAVREEYGDEYLQVAADITNQFTAGCWEPIHVVRRIVHATTIVDPMAQYLVGMDARFELVPLVTHMPLTFQQWIITTLYFGKLVPASVKKALKPRGTPLPTTATGTETAAPTD